MKTFTGSAIPVGYRFDRMDMVLPVIYFFLAAIVGVDFPVLIEF